MTHHVRTNQVDPLYTIFEQHLYNFEDSDTDRKTFIGNVIQEYFTYLRKLNIVIPKSLESAIHEELSAQVKTMLVKKIYGCLTLSDYQKKISPAVKRQVKKRYSRLSNAKPRADRRTG